MRRLALAAALVLTAAAASAQSWRPIGPFGADVDALVVHPKDPKLVWAATRVGLYKSTDGGRTFQNAAKGHEERSFTSLAVDPTNPKVCFAGGFRGGVFKTSDGGATWKPLRGKTSTSFSSSGDRRGMRAVAVDANGKTVLFAQGLHRSATGGDDFVEVDHARYGGSYSDIQVLAFDPRNAKVAWAGDMGGIRRSTDGGLNWRSVDFPVGTANTRQIAIHPKTGTVYVGAQNDLYRSEDDGATWKKVGGGLNGGPVRAIALDPNDPRRLFVSARAKPSGDVSAIYLSTDGGENFQDVSGKSLPWEPVQALAIDPSDPQILHAGLTFSGVVTTRDGGETWDAPAAGFGEGSRTGTALALAPDGALWAATYGWLHRTADLGKTWTSVPTGHNFRGAEVTAIGIWGKDPVRLVAGSKENALSVSSDGGKTFQKPGRASIGVYCLAGDPRDATTLWACNEDGGVFRTDSGSSWRRYGDEDFNQSLHAIAFDPSNPQTIVAVPLGGGLFKSVNGGKKWKDFGKGLQTKKGGFTDFSEYHKLEWLSWHPATKVLWGASPDRGVFRSENGGETWTRSGLEEERLTCFAVDPSDGKRLAAGTRDHGVLVSSDGGATWKATTKGFPDDDGRIEQANAVIFVPAPGGASKLVAGVKDGAFVVLE